MLLPKTRVSPITSRKKAAPKPPTHEPKKVEYELHVITRPELTGEEDLILMKINRRQRQVIVHSVIYYRMNNNLIEDKTWDSWAMELVALQRQYPELSKKSVFWEDMKDFDATTGFHLADHPWGMERATQLLAYVQKHSKKLKEG